MADNEEQKNKKDKGFFADNLYDPDTDSFLDMINNLQNALGSSASNASTLRPSAIRLDDFSTRLKSMYRDLQKNVLDGVQTSINNGAISNMPQFELASLINTRSLMQPGNKQGEALIAKQFGEIFRQRENFDKERLFQDTEKTTNSSSVNRLRDLENQFRRDGDITNAENYRRARTTAEGTRADHAYNVNRNAFRNNSEMLNLLPQGFSYLSGGAFAHAAVKGAGEGFYKNYSDKGGGMLARLYSADRTSKASMERETHLSSIMTQDVPNAIGDTQNRASNAIKSLDGTAADAFDLLSESINRASKNVATAMQERGIARKNGVTYTPEYDNVIADNEAAVNRDRAKQAKIVNDVMGTQYSGLDPDAQAQIKSKLNTAYSQNQTFVRDEARVRQDYADVMSGNDKAFITRNLKDNINYDQTAKYLSGTDRKKYDSQIDDRIALMTPLNGIDDTPRQIAVNDKIDMLLRNFSGVNKNNPNYASERNDLISAISNDTTPDFEKMIKRTTTSSKANMYEGMGVSTDDPALQSMFYKSARRFRKEEAELSEGDDPRYLSKIIKAGTSSRSVQVADPDITDFVRGSSPFKAFKVFNSDSTAKLATSMAGIENRIDSIIQLADANKGIYDNVAAKMSTWRSAVQSINTRLEDTNLTDAKRNSLEKSRAEIISSGMKYESNEAVLSGTKKQSFGDGMRETMHSVGTGVDEFLGRSLNFMQMGLMFSMSSFLMQGVSQMPMEAVQMGNQPFIGGLSGITGFSTVTGELQSFVGQIPQITGALQTNLATIEALSGSRTSAQAAVGSALEISKQQPIQFPQAMEIVSALSIYPETKSMATNPAFQQKAFETTQFLSMLAPEQGIGGALFAIRELLGGQTRSLERRFNISTEILSANAGKSNTEFMAMGGGQKINTLWESLNSMFGGQEILLKKGMQVDVQAKNISDTLIQSLIAPLAMKTVPALADRQKEIFSDPEKTKLIYGENLFETVKTIATSNIDKQIKGEEAFGKFTSKEERQERITKETSKIGVEMGGTVLGSIGLLLQSINGAVGSMMNAFNPGVGLTDMLLEGFITPISKTVGAFNSTMRADNISDTDKESVAETFVPNLMKNLKNGFSRVSSSMDASGISDMMVEITSGIKSALNIGMKKMMTGILRETISSAVDMPATMAQAFGGFINNKMKPTTRKPITSTDPLEAVELEQQQKAEETQKTRELFGGIGSTSLSLGGYALAMNQKMSGLQRIGGFLALGGLASSVDEISKNGITPSSMQTLLPAILSTGMFIPTIAGGIGDFKKRNLVNEAYKKSDLDFEKKYGTASQYKIGEQDVTRQSATQQGTTHRTYVDTDGVLRMGGRSQTIQPTREKIGTLGEYRQARDIYRQQAEDELKGSFKSQRALNIASIAGGFAVGGFSAWQGMKRVDRSDPMREGYESTGVAAGSAIAGLGVSLLALGGPAGIAAAAIGTIIGALTAFKPSLAGDFVKGISDILTISGIAPEKTVRQQTKMEAAFEDSSQEGVDTFNNMREKLEQQYKVDKRITRDPEYAEASIGLKNLTNDFLSERYQQERNLFGNDPKLIDALDKKYNDVQAPFQTFFATMSDITGGISDAKKKGDGAKVTELTDKYNTTYEKFLEKNGVQEVANKSNIDAVLEKQQGYQQTVKEKEDLMVGAGMRRAWVDFFDQNSNFMSPVLTEGPILDRLQSIVTAAQTELPRAAANAGTFDNLRQINFDMGITGSSNEVIDKYESIYGKTAKNILETDPSLAGRLIADEKGGAQFREFIMTRGYEASPDAMNRAINMASIASGGGAALHLEKTFNEFGAAGANSGFSSLNTEEKALMILSKEMLKGGKFDKDDSDITQVQIADMIGGGKSVIDILKMRGITEDQYDKYAYKGGKNPLIKTEDVYKEFSNMYKSASTQEEKETIAKSGGLTIGSEGKPVEYKDMSKEEKEIFKKNYNLDYLQERKDMEVIIKNSPLPVIVVGWNVGNTPQPNKETTGETLKQAASVVNTQSEKQTENSLGQIKNELVGVEAKTVTRSTAKEVASDTIKESDKKSYMTDDITKNLEAKKSAREKLSITENLNAANKRFDDANDEDKLKMLDNDQAPGYVPTLIASAIKNIIGGPTRTWEILTKGSVSEENKKLDIYEEAEKASERKNYNVNRAKGVGFMEGDTGKFYSQKYFKAYEYYRKNYGEKLDEAKASGEYSMNDISLEDSKAMKVTAKEFGIDANRFSRLIKEKNLNEMVSNAGLIPTPESEKTSEISSKKPEQETELSRETAKINELSRKKDFSISDRIRYVGELEKMKKGTPTQQLLYNIEREKQGISEVPEFASVDDAEKYLNSLPDTPVWGSGKMRGIGTGKNKVQTFDGRGSNDTEEFWRQSQEDREKLSGWAGNIGNRQRTEGDRFGFGSVKYTEDGDFELGEQRGENYRSNMAMQDAMKFLSKPQIPKWLEDESGYSDYRELVKGGGSMFGNTMSMDAWKKAGAPTTFDELTKSLFTGAPSEEDPLQVAATGLKNAMNTGGVGGDALLASNEKVLETANFTAGVVNVNVVG